MFVLCSQVVGRTGAGKSSIMQTLFRIVEITSGSIEVDGIDITKIGLADLRKKIAILPQDAFLFAGTVRSNLDPFGEHQDAELYDALKRAWLVDQDQPAPGAGGAAGPAAASPTVATPSNSTRFTLDLVIEDEGQNLSVGERSLVSLARALVKNSKIIVLECVHTVLAASYPFALSDSTSSPCRLTQRSDGFCRLCDRFAHPVDHPQRVQRQDPPCHRPPTPHHHRQRPRPRHGCRQSRRIRQ